MNQLARSPAVRPLDVTKPLAAVERMKEILTKVDPAWCERFENDLVLAANFYQTYAPESWKKAEKEVA